jgi:hypothetical protein
LVSVSDSPLSGDHRGVDPTRLQVTLTSMSVALHTAGGSAVTVCPGAGKDQTGSDHLRGAIASALR